MPLISVTRLRVRSIGFLPQFVVYSLLSARQARHAAGFLAGRLIGDAKRTFWTLTAWENESAMRSYRRAEAHGRAMPKLLIWCDEASVAHWTQDSPELPSLQEAYRRLLWEGRMSKVDHPSPAQLAGTIAQPATSRGTLSLKPA